MAIPVGFGQAQIIFTGAAVPEGAMTTFGFESVLGGSPSLDAQAIATCWAGNMKGTYSSSITASQVMVKWGPEEDGPSGLSPIVSGAGTLAAAVSPPNVASLFHKNTSLGGRRGRGRMYIPGVPEATVGIDGSIDPAQLPFWTTAADNFLDALTAASVPMVLLHNPGTQWALVNGQPRRIPDGTFGPAPTPVTSLTPATKAATQRRRMR